MSHTVYPQGVDSVAAVERFYALVADGALDAAGGDCLARGTRWDLVGPESVATRDAAAVAEQMLGRGDGVSLVDLSVAGEWVIAVPRSDREADAEPSAYTCFRVTRGRIRGVMSVFGSDNAVSAALGA